MNRWTPGTIGHDFDFKPILEPFKPFKKHLTVVSGLGNKPAESSAVHAIVPATWLSCVHPRQSHAPYGGVTIDQIAAQHIGQDTPLPSLEVATEEEGGGAACDGTYGCSYGRTISFRTPTTPLPMEFDPRKAFEKIFGRGNERSAAQSRVARLPEPARHGATAKRTSSRRRSARATACSSATISTACARSSGACELRASATCRSRFARRAGRDAELRQAACG